MNLDDADERGVLAGEYVLGTLDDAERAAFEAAMGGDAGLRAEVGEWQDRLLGLARQAVPAEPAASLWARIEAALPAAGAAGSSTPAMLQPQTQSGTQPQPQPQPQRDRPSPMPPPRRTVVSMPWWQRLGVWQGISAAALACVALLATLLVVRPAADEPVQYLALLRAPDTSNTGWIVEGYPGGRLKLVPVGEGAGVSSATPSGRSLQFWTKPEGAAGPTSLGLVQAGTALTVPSSRLPGLGERQLFEITLEPEGGSTIGRPTGPILFVGRTQRL